MKKIRKILFKGKRTDNGKWLEGSLLDFYEKTYIVHLDDMTRTTFDVYPETVGQYTGLNDLHGTKIFEGDIIEFVDGLDEKHKGVVYWRSGSYNVDCSKFSNKEYGNYFRLFTAYACEAKVIGNIHDNPEMLGGEQNASD
ncbi:MAG: YopX family protein [Alistipes senegalensis]|nr:YopX family protein [Alistipes senegalensis]